MLVASMGVSPAPFILRPSAVPVISPTLTLLPGGHFFLRYLIPTQQERRLAVAKLQGGFFCYYCYEPEDENDVNSLVIDHVIPRQAGGSDDLRNLVLACNACNIRKLDRQEEKLLQFGYETLAQRVAGVKAERADWGVDEVKARLAAPCEGVDPGYDRYERFLTETPTAKVINAALTYAGMSSERLRRKAGLGGWTLDRLRREEQKGSVKMWYRLSQATGYPIQEFLKVYRGWISEEGTPQRELEYAAALQGYRCSELDWLTPTSRESQYRMLRGYYQITAETDTVAAKLKLTPAAAASLVARVNAAALPLPRPLPRPRPLPLPLPLPRPLPRPLPLPLPRWTAICDAYMAQCGHRKYIKMSLHLGLPPHAWRNYRCLENFPSLALFQKICAAAGETADALLFELETLVYAKRGIQVPERFQAPQRSLEHILYLHEEPILNGAGFGGLKGAARRGFQLREDMLFFLMDRLSLSREAILLAWEKTMWLHEAISERSGGAVG